MQQRQNLPYSLSKITPNTIDNGPLRFDIKIHSEVIVRVNHCRILPSLTSKIILNQQSASCQPVVFCEIVDTENL